MISFAGTRESAHPIHNTGGVCPFAKSLKNSGSFSNCLAAHDLLFSNNWLLNFSIFKCFLFLKYLLKLVSHYFNLRDSESCYLNIAFNSCVRFKLLNHLKHIKIYFATFRTINNYMYIVWKIIQYRVNTSFI